MNQVKTVADITMPTCWARRGRKMLPTGGSLLAPSRARFQGLGHWCLFRLSPAAWAVSEYKMLGLDEITASHNGPVLFCFLNFFKVLH